MLNGWLRESASDDESDIVKKAKDRGFSPARRVGESGAVTGLTSSTIFIMVELRIDAADYWRTSPGRPVSGSLVNCSAVSGRLK